MSGRRHGKGKQSFFLKSRKREEGPGYRLAYRKAPRPRGQSSFKELQEKEFEGGGVKPDVQQERLARARHHHHGGLIRCHREALGPGGSAVEGRGLGVGCVSGQET